MTLSDHQEVSGKPESAQHDPANKVSQLRPVYLLAGHVLIAVGFVGMFLPILPTTVFWIGAAIFYAKSSPRLYQKLIGHKRFGKPIQLFMEHGVISKTGKSAALLGMSVSAVLIGFAPLDSMVILAGLTVLLIAAIFVLTRPTQV